MAQGRLRMDARIAAMARLARSNDGTVAGAGR